MANICTDALLRFSFGQVVKHSHGAYMTAKAFNGRVICEWLLDCANHAHNRTFPPEADQRVFGQWVKGRQQPPIDERLEPQLFALRLGLKCSLYRK